MKRSIVIVALAAAFLGIGCAAGAATAGGGGTQVILEKLVVQDPQSDTGNQLLVNDKNGAPMFWVNMFGAQSGGEPFCTTDLHLQPVACFGASQYGQYGSTPDVVLYLGGKRYVLTPRDIAWIHRHGG